ncbi:MAG: hypothetical protein WC934_13590 [Acidithiobacillus sp.]|jgi:hypothetical protein|uniref:hypothetical protein n=1 Tax=Acidithiobacillus sp. TaxID=1872118 RepID=UPI0035606285
MKIIDSRKWNSLSELKELGLDRNTTKIFSISDGEDAVLNAVEENDLKCGFRTDLPNNINGYYYPFYLPDLNQKITIDNFRIELSKIWKLNPEYYILVSFSPNLCENQLWDAVVWVTQYRLLIGEISLGSSNSLRYAWKHNHLKTITNIYEYEKVAKVRGDLIRKKIFDRRVEVSCFPTLGLFYWEVGSEDKNLSNFPPLLWN